MKPPALPHSLKSALRAASLFAAILLFPAPRVASAATPPEEVEGLDNAREGNLAAKVVTFYNARPESPKITTGDGSVSKTVAYKLSSDSSHESKQPGTPTTYTATYLVVRFSFTGATFATATRDVADAVIIKATRRGIEDKKGAIVPSERDVMSVVKKVPPTALGLETN